MSRVKSRNGTPLNSLELLYNISRELAAALDLRTVLQRVLSLSMKNVGAVNGSIIILDESGQPVESAIIIGDTLHDHTTPQLREIFQRGLAGWVASHKDAVLIDDTSQDARWLRRPDDEQSKTGPKSAVATPILARGQLVGVITLVHPTTRFFKPEHLNLVKAIADQAGIAVINARLYTESQRQARVMTALANSAAAITGSLNLEEVLQHILEQISQALRVDVVSLALIDPRQNELVFRASTGKHSQNVAGIRLKMGQGIAGWVAQEGQGVIVLDVNKDPRFYGEVDKQTGFKTRAIAAAPIHWREQVIGILEALNPADDIFEPDALLVLTGIGGLAGSAIRHAQLFEALQAAHQRYHDLFEDSIDPIFITDWSGAIVEANRQVELITGFDSKSLRKKSIGQFGVVESGMVGEDFSALTAGETISYETSISTRYGHPVPVQVNVRKVQIEGVYHLQWILHDISERKKLETLQNDLISMIYHDLRSPLANVVSSLDVLETMLPLEDDPALRSLLNIAVRSTERIQRLTNALLDIRRLEAGQSVIHPQAISPGQLIQEALETIQPASETKKQEILVDLPTDLPEIWVDGDMIRRVLINLLENAVKYTSSESQVLLGARCNALDLEVYVQDNGPGIPDSERERIFDKFWRLHEKTEHRGYGLGLAYCRLAVEAHGGRIWVESEPGEGACFKFILPIAAKAPETTGKASN